MPATPNPEALFTNRHASYSRFIRMVGSPHGIRTFFLHSSVIRSDLDAGCGTGVITLAMYDVLVRRQPTPAILQAFDLTPTMLDRFHDALDKRGIEIAETRQANVLDMERLPASWTRYDLVVSASMLEYVPRARLSEALANLRQRLSENGRLVMFITKRNWLTRLMIEPGGNRTSTANENCWTPFNSLVSRTSRFASFRSLPATSPRGGT